MAEYLPWFILSPFDKTHIGQRLQRGEAMNVNENLNRQTLSRQRMVQQVAVREER